MADTKSETPTEKETLKPKPRPIVRLGILLISHSFLVSVVCNAAGVLALFLLLVLAKNTYISENAPILAGAKTNATRHSPCDTTKSWQISMNLFAFHHPADHCQQRHYPLFPKPKSNFIAGAMRLIETPKPSHV